MPPAPRRRRWVREAQIDGHHGQLQRVHKPKRAQPSAASTGRARWTRGGNTRIARCGFEALRRAALFFFFQEQGLGIEQALGTLGKTHEKGRSDRTHASRDVGPRDNRRMPCGIRAHSSNRSVMATCGHHTGPRQHWQAARKRSQPPHGQYTDTPDETGSSRSRETPPRLHGGAQARAPAPPQPRIR